MVTIYPPATRLVLPAFTLDKIEFHHRDNANLRSHKLNTLVKFVQDGQADGAVTNAKLAIIETNRIKGRIAPGAGQVQDLSPADVRTMINVADGATANLGTVTSVGLTVPIGFNLSGSPITTSGTFAISYASGYEPYTSAEKSKLAGVAAGATANLGTVTSVSGTGSVNGLTLTGSISSSGSLTLGGILAINNADWSGTQLSVANGGTGATTAAQARVNLGAGTVTSVSGAGTVNGLTLTGSVTTTGSITLGGTLSGVNLTTAVTGSLPIANGGTGAVTAAGALANLGAGTVTSVSGSGGTTGLTLTGGAITTTGTLTLGGTLAVAHGGTGVTTSTGTGSVVLSNAPTFTGNTLFDVARVNDGTVTAPTFAFRSDTQLGMYRALGGLGALAAGGEDSLRWSTAGAVIPSGKSLIAVPVTVASLPASPSPGSRRMVSDSSVTTFNTVVAGGGSSTVPVFFDGTNWRVG